MKVWRLLFVLGACGVVSVAMAAPEAYDIDSTHTYPSFESEHLWGISIWRGKFNSTRGRVTLDRTGRTGEMEITVDMASVDFGWDELNKHAKEPALLDVARYPTATYRGTFSRYKDDLPAEVQGELTLHGVTKPVTLTINRFKCLQNPVTKKDICGADAAATLNRADFGINMGQEHGFSQEVKLAIQVEVIKAD